MASIKAKHDSALDQARHENEGFVRTRAVEHAQFDEYMHQVRVGLQAVWRCVCSRASSDTGGKIVLESHVTSSLHHFSFAFAFAGLISNNMCLKFAPHAVAPHAVQLLRPWGRL